MIRSAAKLQCDWSGRGTIARHNNLKISVGLRDCHINVMRIMCELAQRDVGVGRRSGGLSSEELASSMKARLDHGAPELAHHIMHLSKSCTVQHPTSSLKLDGFLRTAVRTAQLLN